MSFPSLMLIEDRRSRCSVIALAPEDLQTVICSGSKAFDLGCSHSKSKESVIPSCRPP